MGAVRVRTSVVDAGTGLATVARLLRRVDVLVVLTPPGRADLALLDALAGLALRARRTGRTLQVCGGRVGAADLADLVGIAGTLAEPSPGRGRRGDG